MKNKKKTMYIIACIFLLFGIAFIVYGVLRLTRIGDIISIIQSKPSELAKLIEVLPYDKSAPFELTYKEPNFYFIYKDKFYYYDYTLNGLYVMNKDCTDKKLIVSDYDIKHPSFYLVYNNEAYFYNIEGYLTSEEKVNKKVNLITGKVTSLNNDYKFLPQYFNDGIVPSIGNRNITDSSTFRKYNLSTNSVELENKYNYNTNYKYIYDYSNGDIYSIKNNYNDIDHNQDNFDVEFELRKNNEYMANFTLEKVFVNRTLGLWVDCLYVDNNALFLYDGVTLYKYEFVTKEITKASTMNLNNSVILNSNNYNDLFIYNGDDGCLYILDKNNLTFTKMLEIPEDRSKIHNQSYRISTGGFDLYDDGSKLIIPIRANNLRYKTTDDESLGKVIIYDKTTKEVQTIERVRRAFFDYENNLLHLFVKYFNTYEIKEIILE